MKLRKLLVLIIGLLFILNACATVDKPRVEVVPEETPQVSKVLIEQPQRSLKRKVAIARFSNESKYGQSFLLDEKNDRIGKQAMDILSAKLVATEKFIMLERADIEKIDAELARGDISNLNITSDYLILGSVSEFGRKTVSDVGVFSRTKQQMAHATVNIRLVEVQTGQIIYSEESSGEAYSEAGTVMGVGSRAGYDSSINDKAISAAISKLVNNVIENLLDKPWRSYLLSYDSGQYVMAGGESQGIRAGDIFEVVRKGKKVKNPQTGMLIELPGQIVGKVKVEQLIGSTINDEMAICSTISGDIPANNFAELFVQEANKI